MVLRKNYYFQKGKEYYGFEEKLLFSGEYLNGLKWNGKGYNYSGNEEYELKNGCGKVKEYNIFGKLIFEGEYLNGQKNGKGNEYYDNNKLKFEGYYLNGIRWNGKGYNSFGIEEYELKNGSGKVKEYNDCDKLIFEGEYLNGQKNGLGIIYDPVLGKVTFKGYFLDEKKMGMEENIFKIN